MIVARVVGNVWSTKKNDRINALRLLFVEPLGRDMKPSGPMIVAADEIGAGRDELVLVTLGAPAMAAVNRDEPVPVDAVVVGIVDSMELTEGKGKA